MTDTTTEITDPVDDQLDEQVEPVVEDQLEDDTSTDDTDEMFPRSVVEKLRKENAEARVKAKDRDDLAQRLHVALVAATGRLADPTDLEFDQTHLDDPDALTAAIDALVDRKPHLASRRPTGSIGQGVSAPAHSVDLAGILRTNAN